MLQGITNLGIRRHGQRQGGTCPLEKEMLSSVLCISSYSQSTNYLCIILTIFWRVGVVHFSLCYEEKTRKKVVNFFGGKNAPKRKSWLRPNLPPPQKKILQVPMVTNQNARLIMHCTVHSAEQRTELH